MKIKTWLLSSYLIVMILPLITAYLLFAWIYSYNDDQKVKEYIMVSTELANAKSILKNPSFYTVNRERPEVEGLVSDQLSVVLYNEDGFVIYSSSPAYTMHSVEGKERLYEGLYSLNQGFRTYTYKQPVFDGNRLAGFFQMELARDAWVSGVTERTWLVFGLFIALFLAIYATVVVFVNRKLNRRLVSLKEEMTAFAEGQQFEEETTNKDEIGELQQHFYNMKNQISAAREVIEKEQRAKEYMIATISHDLKTPLTSIRAYAESLDVNENLSLQEQAEYRKVIVEKSNFMKQMLDDLLMYTLLQSPTYEMELVEVEGGEFFDMLVSDYEPLCKEKGISLHVHADVQGMYEVNPKQMMRVADNLMSNAIQHTDRNGEIGIAALSENVERLAWLFDFVPLAYPFNFDNHMYFIVQNSGTGIAKEEINKLFDPLFQADESRNKRDAKGTGLGLSITKQIIEKHGGKVQILSETGTGTCIICRLPKMMEKDECNERI